MKKILLSTLALISSAVCSAQVVQQYSDPFTGQNQYELETFTVRNTAVEFQNVQTRMCDVVSNVIFKPMVVEMELISETKKTLKVELDEAMQESLGSKLDNLRSYATYVMAKKENADVIVAATYNITKNSTNKTLSIEISGFPAKFKNWRQMNNSDVEWINATKSNK